MMALKTGIWVYIGLTLISFACASKATPILFANPSLDDNGNTSYHNKPNAFVADNFLLREQAEVESFSITGIGSHPNDGPMDLDFTLAFDWRRYADGVTWDDRPGASISLGPQKHDGDGTPAIATAIKFPVQPSETFIEYEIDIPDIILGPGQFGLALHP